MKYSSVCVMTFLLLFPLAADDAVRGDLPVDEKLVQYLAGIELLEHSPTAGGSVLAEKYRELCSMTGLVADSAAERIGRFKNRPELWQKVRQKVLELLQSNQ
jgi:hypothetical protein